MVVVTARSGSRLENAAVRQPAQKAFGTREIALHVRATASTAAAARFRSASPWVDHNAKNVIREYPGSHRTPRWREPDSNHRSRVRKSGRCQVAAIRPGSVEH